MGNIISFDDKVSVGDDSLSMSNGLTDVFIDYLILSGSQLADLESEKRRMTINSIDEKNLLEWLSASEIDDPINSGFPKCPKHKVLLSFWGCKFCNDRS